MKTRLRAVRQRLLRALAPSLVQAANQLPRLKRRIAQQDAQIRALQREVAALKVSRRRLADLQAQINENRRLQQRVAELTDVVAEVLVPIADRDDARVQKALEAFGRTSF